MGYKFKCMEHMAYETHYQWYYTHCLQALPGFNWLFKNLLYACKHIVVISFGSLLRHRSRLWPISSAYLKTTAAELIVSFTTIKRRVGHTFNGKAFTIT